MNQDSGLETKRLVASAIESERQQHMFIPQISINPSVDTTAYDYLQATEATIMESLFAQYIVALVAENTLRQVPFNIADIDISGGGDGHTFVLRILKTTALVSGAPLVAVGWPAIGLAQAKAVFWMGSDADALNAYSESAIAALQNGESALNFLFVGTAGAAKGTRFMAFMAAIVAGGG